MIHRVRVMAAYIAAAELYVLAVAVGLSIVSVRLLALTVALAVLFWLIRWLAYGTLTVRTPLDLPILGLALMTPVTLWVTALPMITQEQVLRLLSGLALYYASINWAYNPQLAVISRLRLFLLASILPMIGLALALIAPLTVNWPLAKLPIPDSLYPHLPRLLAEGVHPNVMAGTLVILLPIPLTYLFFGWLTAQNMEATNHWLPKRLLSGFSLLFIISTIAMLVMLMLTQSRGAFVALAIMLIVLLIFRWRRSFLIFIVAAALAAIFFSQQPLLFKQLINLLASGGAVSNTEVRMEAWSRAWYMLHEFPFTGIGMGSYQQVADIMYPFFTVPQALPHAHNLLLQISVDLGIPGLIAYLALLINLFAMLFASIQAHHTTYAQRTLAIGAAGSLIAMLVHGLLDAVTWDTRLAFIPWLLFALITLLFLQMEQERPFLKP